MFLLASMVVALSNSWSLLFCFFLFLVVFDWVILFVELMKISGTKCKINWPGPFKLYEPKAMAADEKQFLTLQRLIIYLFFSFNDKK